MVDGDYFNTLLLGIICRSIDGLESTNCHLEIIKFILALIIKFICTLYLLVKVFISYDLYDPQI